MCVLQETYSHSTEIAENQVQSLIKWVAKLQNKYRLGDQ